MEKRAQGVTLRARAIDPATGFAQQRVIHGHHQGSIDREALFNPHTDLTVSLQTNQPVVCGFQPPTRLNVSRIFLFNTFSYSIAREGVEKKNAHWSETVTPKLVGGLNPQKGG